MLDKRKKYTDKDMLGFKRSDMFLSEWNIYRRKPLNITENLHQDILDICCRATGSDPIKIISRTRKPNTVFARYMIMYFMKIISEQEKEVENLILEDLGALVGRDHSTVTHGLKAVNDVIDVNSCRDKRLWWFLEAKEEIEKRSRLTIEL